jgi:hypothetical protein
LLKQHRFLALFVTAGHPTPALSERELEAAMLGAMGDASKMLSAPSASGAAWPPS